MTKGIITYKGVPPFSEKVLELQIKRIQIKEREFELKKKQSDYLRQTLKLQFGNACGR